MSLASKAYFEVKIHSKIPLWDLVALATLSVSNPKQTHSWKSRPLPLDGQHNVFHMSRSMWNYKHDHFDLKTYHYLRWALDFRLKLVWDFLLNLAELIQHHRNYRMVSWMMNIWEQYPFLQSSSLGLMTTIKSFQLPQPESVLSNPPVLPAHSGPGSILAQSSHQSFKPWMHPGRPSSLHIETHPLASDKWDLLKPAKITCLILTHRGQSEDCYTHWEKSR